MKLKDFKVITTLIFDSLMTEVMKAPQLKIKDEEVKQDILQNGLYHFTSSESADKILESGHIKPTKGVLNNHTVVNKVFMFAGIPEFDLYRKNLPKSANPLVAGNLELSAVKINIDEEQLDKYRRRPQDGAISYSGKCSIEDKDVKKVALVIDLDQNKKYIIREKTEEEILKGYNPSEELLKKQQEDKTGKFKEDINQHIIEREYTYKSLKEALAKLKNKISNLFNKNKALNESNENKNKDNILNFKTEGHNDKNSINNLLGEHVKDIYELPIDKTLTDNIIQIDADIVKDNSDDMIQSN